MGGVWVADLAGMGAEGSDPTPRRVMCPGRQGAGGWG